MLYPFEGARVVQGGERQRESLWVFFTLFLRSFILLRELECVVGASAVGSGAKGDQRCARGFAVLQYTRKHGLVRESDREEGLCYKWL